MFILLFIIGIIHAVFFMLVAVSIHEDLDASSLRKFFAFIIAFFIPIIGPAIAGTMVAETLPPELKGGSSSNGGGSYSGSSDGCGGDGGGCA